MEIGCLKPGSGEVFKDCPEWPEMVVVPAELLRSNARRVCGIRHGPRVTRPISPRAPARPMRILNWRLPGFAQYDNHPVVCVNWLDARAYTAWLSRKTGKSYACSQRRSASM